MGYASCVIFTNVAFLVKLEYQLLPYTASFTLTEGYWVLRHVMLNFFCKCDRTFLWLNVLFMLPLTLTPFIGC